MMNLCYAKFIRRMFILGFLSTAATKGFSFGESRNSSYPAASISSASSLSKFHGGNFQTTRNYTISEKARLVTWTIGTARDCNGTFVIQEQVNGSLFGERRRSYYRCCLGYQRPIDTGKADSFCTAEHGSDINHEHASVISQEKILSVLLVQQHSDRDDHVATRDAGKDKLESKSEISDNLKMVSTPSYDDQINDGIEVNEMNKSSEGIFRTFADFKDGQNSKGSTKVSLSIQDDNDDVDGVHMLRQGPSYDAAKINLTLDGDDVTVVTNRTIQIGDRLVISVIVPRPNRSSAEPPTTQFFWKETRHAHLKQFFGRKCRTAGVCSIVLPISKRIPRIKFLPRETRRAVNVGARIVYSPTESLNEMTSFFLENPVDATMEKSYKNSTKRKSGNNWFVSYNRINIVCVAVTCSFSLYVLQHYLRK